MGLELATSSTGRADDTKQRELHTAECKNRNYTGTLKSNEDAVVWLHCKKNSSCTSLETLWPLQEWRPALSLIILFAPIVTGSWVNYLNRTIFGEYIQFIPAQTEFVRWRYQRVSSPFMTDSCSCSNSQLNLITLNLDAGPSELAYCHDQVIPLCFWINSINCDLAFWYDIILPSDKTWLDSAVTLEHSKTQLFLKKLSDVPVVMLRQKWFGTACNNLF